MSGASATSAGVLIENNDIHSVTGNSGVISIDSNKVVGNKVNVNMNGQHDTFVESPLGAPVINQRPTVLVNGSHDTVENIPTQSAGPPSLQAQVAILQELGLLAPSQDQANKPQRP